VTWPEAAGIAGVLLILIAYAGAQLERIDPLKAPALLLNLAGAGLIILSLIYDWNLPAFLMETAWAGVAGYGLVRLALRRRAGPGSKAS